MRSAVIGMLGLVVASGSAPLPAAAAETARGVVYEDVDANGLRDADEPGLAGVRVSNGREIVRSDDQGRWALPVDEADVLFLIKPQDYAVPVDGHMLPRFYYVHQPAGSPAGLRYPGIAPTGPLPASIDFPLLRRDEPRRFEAVLFADPQPQTSAELDFFRDDVVAEVIGTRAAFGMTMGDILYDDLSLFPRYNAIVGQIGIPWYNVPGNHDLNLLAPDDEHSLETFKRNYGPPFYAFDYGDAHFVVLDNIFYKGHGDNRDPGRIRDGGGYEARIGREQLRWLERDLAQVPDEKLVFLAMHAPLRTYLALDDAPEAATVDRRKLLALLKGRRHLYAVAGHTHTTEHHYFGVDDGFAGPGLLHHHVLATGAGSWWSGPLDARGIAVADQRDGTPNGYHVLEVDGVEVKVRYKAAGFPAEHQMRIVYDVEHHRHRPEAQRDFRPGAHLDGRISVDEVPATDVVVNVFDGGPQTRVEMSLDGREAIQLTRRNMPDPFVNELFIRNPELKKPWVDALPSSHIFVADLPDDLGPGVYTLTVRAHDEFGRVHHAHNVLEISGSSATPKPELRYPRESAESSSPGS